MKFTHHRLKDIELVRLDSTGGRKYRTPAGDCYPSATTVLSFEPKPEIELWKAKVGEAEAKAVMNRACARGTAIHTLAEDYLNNKEPVVSMFDLDIWKSFKPILDRIDNVRLLEGKLYSDRLRLAGTADCVADFDGVLSLIDFKTSGRLKSEEEILSYFLQCAFYIMMVYERYNLKIRQIVVMIAIDSEEPLLFIKDVKEYIEPAIALINRYYASIGNM